MLAVFSADAYPFLAFWDLTCHFEDAGIGIFCLHCAAENKETKHGSNDQEASRGKNAEIVLVPCLHSAEVQLFPVVWIFMRSLGVICYNRWILSEGHKNYVKELQFLTYFN